MSPDRDLIRLRLRHSLCPSCGARPAPRRVLCAACLDAGMAWCAACEVVEAAATAFYAPRPSELKKGATYGPHKACKCAVKRKWATEAERAAAVVRGAKASNRRQHLRALRRVRRIMALRAAGERWEIIAAMMRSTVDGVKCCYYSHRNQVKER